MQWDVLRCIHKNPDLSLHALAEATFQTDQSMGELAKRMIKRGLIERIDGAGRAVRHQLTDAGLAAYQAGSDITGEVVDETVGRLSASERVLLFDLIEKALAG